MADGTGVLVRTEEAHAFAVRVMQAVGTIPRHAHMLADILVESDLRGHYSHGLNRLTMYISEIRSHVTFTNDISPVILKESEATALVDGKSLLGAVVGHFCIDLAIEKAKKCGVGWVCTRGSNHFGIAGYYSTRAMEQGMLGLAFTSTAPSLVPTRAKHRTLGTNPLSLAAPGNNGDSFVLDMATTSVARGKTDILAMKKKPMPPGWAVDDDGKETYDPNNFAGLQPLGGKEESSGYKGYGLSFMVEILCGVLSGGAYGPFVREYMHHENPANLGQCFIAVNLDSFADGFQDRLSTLMDHCRNLEPAEEGKYVCVPGDPEKKHGEEVKRLGGIPYLPKQIEKMDSIAEDLGVQKIQRLKL